MVVLVVAVRQLDAVLRGQGVHAVEGDTPEAKGTLCLFRFGVGPDGWGGGGWVACPAAQHHPAVGRLAFGGGFLGVPHKVAAGTHTVGVDGFHQVIVVEMHLIFREQLGDGAEVDIAV